MKNASGKNIQKKMVRTNKILLNLIFINFEGCINAHEKHKSTCSCPNKNKLLHNQNC